MYSLAGTTAISDIDATFRLIRSSGKAATDWLQDKLKGSRWALRALNQPLSNIPLEKWKAGPRTTNGNEQAHHNVNLDGTQLSLLAGIMHGMEFDSRLLRGRLAFATSGVQTRYTLGSDWQRAALSLKRGENISQKVRGPHDEAIDEAKAALEAMHADAQYQASVLTAPSSSASQLAGARKRLRELDEAIPEHQARLRKLSKVGSGRITLHGALQRPYDQNLLRSPSPRREPSPGTAATFPAHGPSPAGPESDPSPRASQFSSLTTFPHDIFNATRTSAFPDTSFAYWQSEGIHDSRLDALPPSSSFFPALQLHSAPSTQLSTAYDPFQHGPFMTLRQPFLPDASHDLPASSGFTFPAFDALYPASPHLDPIAFSASSYGPSSLPQTPAPVSPSSNPLDRALRSIRSHHAGPSLPDATSYSFSNAS